MPFSTRVKGPPGLEPTASMAVIVCSGVLPPSRARPESSTRLAISLACSGSPASRRTSIATCLAGSPVVARRLAMVATSFVSSSVRAGGGARGVRRRRRSVLRAARAAVRWERAWRHRLRAGQRQIGPPVSQSMQRTLSPSRLKPCRSGIGLSGGPEVALVAVAGLPAFDEQDARGGRLAVAAQVGRLVAGLDDGRDRVLEGPGGLGEEADLGLGVEAFEFGDQFLDGHCASRRWSWLVRAGGSASGVSRLEPGARSGVRSSKSWPSCRPTWLRRASRSFHW